MNNFCSNCGTSIQVKSTFCSECGHQVNNSIIPIEESPSKVVYIDRPIQETKVKTKGKKSFLIATIIIVLFVLAFTNPIKEKHIDEVNQAVKKTLNKKASIALFDKSKADNQILAGLGLLFGEDLVTGVADKFISRQNFIFFSLTEVLLKDEYSYIGIGILDNVIIFKGFEDRLSTIYDKLSEKSNENNNKVTLEPGELDDIGELDDTVVDSAETEVESNNVDPSLKGFLD